MFEYKGPIVTIVMDGIGLRDSEEGNAVKLSYMLSAAERLTS